MIPNCTRCGHRAPAHYGYNDSCSYTDCGCTHYEAPKLPPVYPELVPREKLHRVTINRIKGDKYAGPKTECVCICGWNFRQSRIWSDVNAAYEIKEHFENVAHGTHRYLNAQ